MRGTYQTPLDFFADRRSHPGRIRKTHGIARFRYSLCGRFCTGYRRLAVRDECHAGLYVEIRDRKNVLSIGRVQTPTLALVVERQKAIENFKPETYWEIRTNYREGLFSCLRGRFNKKEEAEALLEKITPLELEILSIERKKAMEHPPKLFDLTLLQVECNRKFAYTAENTLKIIQSLYEKKLTTYPRVDTNFLPNDQYAKVPKILQGLNLMRL